MFTKIKKIDKFAVFNGFDWDSSVRDDKNSIAEFKALNIIYGRNYSGKTTLSRMFRSMEKGELHAKYPDAVFEFEHTGTDRLCQLDVSNCSYDIRVYNRDYISDNLKWLIDEDGTITPFAILGESNILIEKQITEKEKLLGSEVEKTGLKYDLKKKLDDYQSQRRKRETKEAALERKLMDKANQEIKTNPLYNEVTYNITKIRADIAKIQKSNIQLLDDKVVESKKKLLKEERKDNIDPVSGFSSSFISLHDKAKYLLSKEIRPTESIQELLNDALLQEWVRDGIGHHKNKRTTCAFCGSDIPADLWDKLDAHFSKESEGLRKELDSLIESVNTEKRLAKNISMIKQDQLYSIYHENFRSLIDSLGEKVKTYLSNMDKLIADVEGRKKNIFETKSLSQLNDNSDEIAKIIADINKLIESHNAKTNSLSSDQEKAKKALLLDEVNVFINKIDYTEKVKEIKTLSEIEEEKLKLKNQTATEIFGMEKEIAELKTKLKDERQGAEKVNEYLNNYFGHKGIRLATVEDQEDSGIAFKIMRGDKEAHNLSEGECSLVAFCYFIARLDDIDTKDKELIIWIDDPVSSLDYNHIFFVYSLIESAIAKPYKKPDNTKVYNYKQLFISTHNLDFLKYLKMISRTNTKSVQYFMVDKVTEEKSEIRLMPEYLKKYTTEFNYLFHQIYKCANAGNANKEHECFYNFGNNLRKFLDAYLFYRYPANQSIKDKMDMFFAGNQAASDLANRVDNEFSHLEHIFDRSMRPIDIPEIPKLAKYVLSKIQTKDSDQYIAMLQSIGEA